MAFLRSCARWRWSITAFVMVAVGSSYVVGQSGEAARMHSVAELQKDLDVLEAKLRRMHPALHMYASPEQLDHCLDSLRSSIRTQTTDLRFLSTIAALYPLIGDGHTMFLPGPLSASRGLSARHLPVDAVWLDGALYIRANGTDDIRLLPGTEILSINGIASNAIMDTLIRRQIRDGFNMTYPVWILNNWFRQYYRFSFGEPETFTLEVQTDRGVDRVVANALQPDRIHDNIQRNHPGLVDGDAQFRLQLSEPQCTAVLTIPSFERSAVSGAEIDVAFATMRDRGVQHLILDLRGNQGGEPKLAERVLGHLLSTSYTLVQKGPFSGVNRPQSEPYSGQLIVLIDGGCFSATGMVLACLQRSLRATFIGQEAGGNRIILSGSPRRFRLPNTRIDCYVSTRLWQLAEGTNVGHGVMPTISVSPSIDDMINGHDPVMQAALEFIVRP